MTLTMIKPPGPCALCLGLLCCIAQVQASNIQYRSSICVSQQISPDWELSFNEGIRALNGDMDLYYNDSDLGMTYGGLASWLDMSFNMKWAIHEDPSGDWHQEVRPHLGVTVKQKILGMTVKDTSRIEYREIQAHKDRWRYRNKIQAEMPWTVSPLELRPYIGDELWFYLDGTGFYANRVITGFKMPISERLTGDFYYYWNNATIDRRETWLELNVFGFKLHFSF